MLSALQVVVFFGASNSNHNASGRMALPLHLFGKRLLRYEQEENHAILKYLATRDRW
jgi:hypothetical protein